MIATWFTVFFTIIGVLLAIVIPIGGAIYVGIKIFEYTEERFKHREIIHIISVIGYIVLCGVAVLTTLITIANGIS